MKRRTKKQKFQGIYDAYNCIKQGTTVKRSQAKDGSIATKPVVECPNIPEATVLQECLAWFKARGIFCNRHDCGAGDLGHGYATYGIKGAGDIIGVLRSGIHFEVECKKGKGGRLSAIQRQRWHDVHETNGLYLVIHGVEELEHYKELIL